MFAEADFHGTYDGHLDRIEFQNLIHDARNSYFLGALGFDEKCMSSIFEIIDIDGNGYIDIAEFVEACSTLRSPTKLMHVRLLQQEIESMNKTFYTEFKKIE